LFGRNLDLALLFIAKVPDLLFAILLFELAFALKWFMPGFFAISLPFLVTFIRFVNDLFVFMIIYLFVLPALPAGRQVVSRACRGSTTGV